MKYFFIIKRTFNVIKGDYSFAIQGVRTNDKRCCRVYVPVNKQLMEEAMLSVVPSEDFYTVTTPLKSKDIFDRLHKFFGDDFGYTIICN